MNIILDRIQYFLRMALHIHFPITFIFIFIYCSQRFLQIRINKKLIWAFPFTVQSTVRYKIIDLQSVRRWWRWYWCWLRLHTIRATWSSRRTSSSWTTTWGMEEKIDVERRLAERMENWKKRILGNEVETSVCTCVERI